jgi:hypothetical protein
VGELTAELLAELRHRVKAPPQPAAGEPANAEEDDGA